MTTYRYPQEVHDMVKEWAPKLRDRELAALVNDKCGTSFTAGSMKAFRGNHGYRNGMKQWTGEEYWKYQTRYPQGMYEFIRDNSWGVSSAEMASLCNEKFGTSWTSTGMKQFRQRHGIKSGVTGWYQKGHPPGNKGKKLEDYIKDPERVSEIKKRISATQFKKGDAPANELPIGSIVVNSYGYKLRKKQMEGTIWERWELLHRAIWKEHNGPIPKDGYIIFKDGDRLNCNIDNLMLISKAENAILNRMKLRSEDPDLTEAGVAVARLKVAIKEKRKHASKT